MHPRPSSSRQSERGASPENHREIVTSILLAEDHVLVRQTLRKLLEQENGFRVVGEADDGLAAVQLAEQLHPDVLLTDLQMPHLHGFDVIERVRQLSPKTRIVVVSVWVEPPYVLEAFHRGARGYVHKEFAGSDLVPAIHAVLGRKRYLSASLRKRITLPRASLAHA